jgi:NAD(P)H dehydrogenase (quinone)
MNNASKENDMAKVAIVYFSGSGTTHLLAEAVLAGVKSVAGVDTDFIRIDGKDIVDGRYTNKSVIERLVSADGVIFGSPTYMGGMAAQFKAFVDALGEVWFGQQLAGKLAAGFTISSSLSGDKQSTLLTLAVTAAQHCMVWVNCVPFPTHYLGKSDGVNRIGSFMGVMAQQGMNMTGGPATIHDGDKLTGQLFGANFANATHRWVRGK